MSNPIVTAAVLIEASGAALNNAGSDAGQRLDNAAVVKKIRVGQKSYPYVSGQAWRRWWREVLYADFGWTPSPVTREAKSAYTEGSPLEYPDDDLFGYMAARKVKKTSRKRSGKGAPVEEAPSPALVDTGESEEDAAGSGGTQRRISPLKNSLLVAVLPNSITSDFGHFSRDLPVDNPNMVPFEHEHYTTVLQGVFSLSLDQVGRFECGLMRDLPLDAQVPEKAAIVREARGNLFPRIIGLTVEQREQRVVQTLQALSRLRHGANLTRNLSDVAPVVILLGVLDGGNAPFQNLFFTPDDSSVLLNLERLRSVVKDYADRIIPRADGSRNLYFGYRPGVLGNETEVTNAFREPFEGVRLFSGTPREALEGLVGGIKADGLLAQF